MTLALGLQSQQIAQGSRVALLGIGSGINSVMMSTTWNKPVVAGEMDENARQNLMQVVSHAAHNPHGPTRRPANVTASPI